MVNDGTGHCIASADVTQLHEWFGMRRASSFSRLSFLFALFVNSLVHAHPNQLLACRRQALGRWPFSPPAVIVADYSQAATERAGAVDRAARQSNARLMHASPDAGSDGVDVPELTRCKRYHATRKRPPSKNNAIADLRQHDAPYRVCQSDTR